MKKKWMREFIRYYTSIIMSHKASLKFFIYIKLYKACSFTTA